MRHITRTALAIVFALCANTLTAQTTVPQATKYLTTADFQQKVWNYRTAEGKWKYTGSRPCIIDFYATWCGPCRQLAPVLERVAKQYENDIDIYKVDTDKERELAQVFRITSIPTLLFVPMDSIPMLMQGAPPEATLTQIIDKALLGKK